VDSGGCAELLAAKLQAAEAIRICRVWACITSSFRRAFAVTTSDEQVAET